MTIRRFLPVLGVSASFALLLSACVPNNPSGTTLSVEITDTTCSVSEATAKAGVISFALSNNGTDINEFEILAEDQLRIVGEKENLPPGQTINYVAQLDPGTYYTACKFRLVGAHVGLSEFRVTGEAQPVDADRQELIDAAVTNYLGYIRSQVGELLPQVEEFAAAYASGEDDRARAMFTQVRAFYERIEPTAEAFGDLDPRIDYREVDAVEEELDWTGFHRIEKDLWVPEPDALNSDGTSAWLDWEPSTPSQRAEFARLLVGDVQELFEQVTDPNFTISLADISNGAIGLLDEVAVSKITGEEDWWSHTDLNDFAANVQGASVAFGNVRTLALQSDDGKKLVDEIEKQFAALESLLAGYGSLATGFTPYDQVSDAQRKELSDGVNALSEPLSLLTSAVLGL